MKKNTFISILLIGLSLSITSCQKESESGSSTPSETVSTDALPKEDQNKLAFYRETANLLNEIFKSEEVKKSMINAIKNEGGRYGAVALSDIVQMDLHSNHSASISTLKRAIDMEISRTPNKYASLSNFVKDVRLSNTTKNGAEINPMDVEFYIPYSELFSSEEDLTVTYDPIIRDDWNEGTLYTSQSSPKYIERVDDEYSKKNQTLLILPVDQTPESAYSSSVVDMNGKFIYDNPLIGEIAPAGYNYVYKGLLKSNMLNSQAVGTKDILLTTVPAIRVNSTAWCKFFGTALKLAIYRASGDIVYEENGTLRPTAGVHKPIYVKIPKTDINRRNWIPIGILFDDNWTVAEYEQYLIFCSEHNEGSYDVTFNSAVKVGLKDNKISFEAGAEVGFTVNIGLHSITRLSNQLSRTSALVNMVGDRGAGTYTISGTDYTIRRYGIVDMVFNYYHTKAVPYY